MYLYHALVLMFYFALAYICACAFDAIIDGEPKNRAINVLCLIGALAAIAGLTYIIRYAHYLGTIAANIPT